MGSRTPYGLTIKTPKLLTKTVGSKVYLALGGSRKILKNRGFRASAVHTRFSSLLQQGYPKISKNRCFRASVGFVIKVHQILESSCELHP